MHTPRGIALLMAREIEPGDPESEDDDAIETWHPRHHHDDSEPGPDCAACWMHDYDRAVQWASKHPGWTA